MASKRVFFSNKLPNSFVATAKINYCYKNKSAKKYKHTAN